MIWDPFSVWPNERRWIWLTIAGWILLLRGPAFIENLRTKSPPEMIPDFFQEYASARNWFEGQPIYADGVVGGARAARISPCRCWRPSSS